MMQKWKPDTLTKLYVYSMCLMAYAAADVSWLLVVPRPPLYILVSVIVIIKLVREGVVVTPMKAFWMLMWFIFNLIIITEKISFTSILFRLIYFLDIASVILLSHNEMKYLLKVLTHCFVFILIISIPAWILYLVGVPLPHTGPHDHGDGFHVYYNYYFFTTTVSYLSDYFRFSSVFLEPGQMATPCVFLFHLNSRGGKLFQFENIIMMVAIVMSFSLIAYGLFLLSLVVNRLNVKRFRLLAVSLTSLVIVGLGYYFTTNENNAVNALIVSRLEYDKETTIKGYNRTNDYFDYRYDKMMQSKEKYFGIHGRSLDWTANTSGYKKFIVHNGIIGFAVVMVMMLVLWLDIRNRSALMYCIMVVIAFLVRDMLTTPLWLICAIIGAYISGFDNKTVKRSKNISKLNIYTLYSSKF